MEINDSKYQAEIIGYSSVFHNKREKGNNFDIFLGAVLGCPRNLVYKWLVIKC